MGSAPSAMLCAALLCGLAYHKTKKLLAEVSGTGILGGLLACPVAIGLMGVPAGSMTFYACIVPFLVSTVGGTILAGAVLSTPEKTACWRGCRGFCLFPKRKRRKELCIRQCVPRRPNDYGSSE